jgi:hypothetical protein
MDRSALAWLCGKKTRRGVLVVISRRYVLSLRKDHAD